MSYLLNSFHVNGKIHEMQQTSILYLCITSQCASMVLQTTNTWSGCGRDVLQPTSGSGCVDCRKLSLVVIVGF